MIALPPASNVLYMETQLCQEVLMRPLIRHLSDAVV